MTGATGKKILLVSNAFYPEISPRSFRATELAKEFCRQGHSVVVITKFRDYNYEAFLKECPVILKMWKKSRFPAVPQSNTKPLSFVTRILNRILLTFFEYPAIEDVFSVKKMLQDEKGYDLMISFAVPHPVQWGTAWAVSRKKIAVNWIADCGDPYMGDVLDSFRKPFYFGFLEKAFFRRADYVTIPVESARSGYYAEFHHKIKIIPQGFHFELNPKTELIKENNVVEFAYAGGFLEGIRDPSLLMQFLAGVDIPYRFYIYTNQPEFLDKYRDNFSDKLAVSRYIPRDQLLCILAKMDFLINFDNNTSLNVPSKLIDYAIIGRPVLNIDKSFSYPDLEAFLKGNYSRRMILPDPSQYHIENIAKQFLNLMK